MRRAIAICAAVLIAGCGDGSEKLAAVCTSGPGVVAKALGAAPGPVRMDGTPISECFNRNASGADVQIVGGNLLVVAQVLGDKAAGHPESKAALRLGYLIGAARRGAKRNGLGAEIVRRLEQEQGDLGTRSLAFKRGLRAGLAKG